MSQQLVKPKQIAPAPTDGEIMTTVLGVTAWASALTSSGTLQRYYVDGRLAVLTGIAGRFVADRPLTISAVYISANNLGSASSTIIDVNRNGWTVFTTQANRPTLAYNASEPWAKGVPDGNILYEGDGLTIDIDQCATGVEGLSVTVEMVSGVVPAPLVLPDTQLDSYKPGTLTDNRALNAGTAGAWDDTLLLHPSIVEHAGTVYLFYFGSHGSTPGWGVATAPTAGFTGLSWTKYVSNPISTTQPIGYVMYDRDDHIWKTWYTYGTGGGNLSIGYATATNPFGPWTPSGSNPVLSPSVSWEAGKVHNCAVIKESSTSYKMMYGGQDFTTVGTSIGFATSTDGITWTKYASNPVIVPAGTGWMKQGVFSPTTFYKSASTYYIMFSGKQNSVSGDSKNGWASSTDLITWTMGTHNPTLSTTRAWEHALSGSFSDTEDPIYIQIGSNHYIFYDCYYGPGIGVAILPV